MEPTPPPPPLELVLVQLLVVLELGLGLEPEPELELELEATPAQPAKGSVSRAKGKVCWRFAGHLCYGSLLPAQESKTHCYARTHKGNTKTLTKGGASWWMVES